MVVDREQLQRALLVAPTSTWRAGMNNAMHIISSNATPKADDPQTWVVDNTAWYKAMNILARLPSGGRWVWKARERLFWEIDNATKGEKQ